MYVCMSAMTVCALSFHCRKESKLVFLSAFFRTFNILNYILGPVMIRFLVLGTYGTIEDELPIRAVFLTFSLSIPLMFTVGVSTTMGIFSGTEAAVAVYRIQVWLGVCVCV